MGGIDTKNDDSLLNARAGPPVAPPLPSPPMTKCARKGLQTEGASQRGDCCVSTTAIDLWERLFDEGYKADVRIHTDDGGVVYAHACIIVRTPNPTKFNSNRKILVGRFPSNVAMLEFYNSLFRQSENFLSSSWKSKFSHLKWYFTFQDNSGMKIIHPFMIFGCEIIMSLRVDLILFPHEIQWLRPHKCELAWLCSSKTHQQLAILLQGMASPVIRGMLKKSKRKGRYQVLNVSGVPHDAVRVFVRFLYSSW